MTTSPHQLYYSTDYLEGIVRYLEGDHEAATDLLSRVADSAFDMPPMSPFQAERFEDPRYASIYEREQQREARERAKVLEVTCGEGFEHPVWTPMPATCEKYGPASR
jgi:hypothetical protein